MPETDADTSFNKNGRHLAHMCLPHRRGEKNQMTLTTASPRCARPLDTPQPAEVQRKAASANAHAQHGLPGRNNTDTSPKQRQDDASGPGSNIAPALENSALVSRWEALLRTWPASCSSSTALRARRTWRRKALELVSENGGIPKEIRRRVWQTVLEAAVEASSPATSEQADPPPPTVALQTPSLTTHTAATASRRSPKLPTTHSPVVESHRHNPLGPIATASHADDEDDEIQQRMPKSSADVKDSCRPMGCGKDVPRWARPRRNDDGRVSPRLLPREIALDVPRTFGGRDLVDEASAFHTLSDDGERTEKTQFFEQTRLRRLLIHFARTTPGVQYYQGMNFLGGTLLRVFEEPASVSNRGEDTGSRPRRTARSTTIDAATATAFRGLMALVTSLYMPDFSGLRELVAVGGSLLPRFAPKLASVLCSEGLDLMPITAAWCLTFFSSSAMDFDCVLCCWDFLILGTSSRREELMLPNDEDGDSAADNDREYAQRFDDGASSPPPPPATALYALSPAEDFGDRRDHKVGAPRSANRNSSRHKPSSFWPSNNCRASSNGSATSPDNGDASDACVACYTPSEASSDAPAFDTRPGGSSSVKQRQVFSVARRRGRRRARGGDTPESTSSSANDPNDPTFDIVPMSTTRTQRCRAKALKNQSSTAERHAMLLRLCLVMLRLGERATWGAREERGEIDDLQSLSELLEAAQPSPVADDDVSPGAAGSLARQRSGCCFPASTDVLCALLSKTRVDARTIRQYAKRYKKMLTLPNTNPPVALQPPRSTSIRPPSPPPAPKRPRSIELIVAFFRSLARRPLVALFKRRRRPKKQRESSNSRPRSMQPHEAS